MKAAILIMVVLLFSCAYSVGAQQPPMYNYGYSGPANRVAFPTYESMHQPLSHGYQSQEPIFDRPYPWVPQNTPTPGWRSYLWSWLPAPLRGQQPYVPGVTPPPGGDVIVNFVPPRP